MERRGKEGRQRERRGEGERGRERSGERKKEEKQDSLWYREPYARGVRACC